MIEDNTPHLVRGNELIAWTPDGYTTYRRRPNRGTATAITPPSTVAVLRAGYPAQIAASA